MVKLLEERGIISGIKVDTRAHPLAGAPGEVVTEGLDGLRDRMAEYYEIGARFAKWRAVIAIGPHVPSHYCIEVNAHALARYAALAQEAGLVPIVEPEVLMDGDHDISRCYDVTQDTLREVYSQLAVPAGDAGRHPAQVQHGTLRERGIQPSRAGRSSRKDG